MKKDSLFKNRRVLVTGISGFMGFHLSEALLTSGAQICGFTTNLSNCWRLKDYRGKIKLEVVSLEDKNKVESLVKKNDPEYIFHLAASLNHENSLNTLLTQKVANFEGTFNLLLAAVKINNLHKFIHVGTIGEYGKIPTPFKETDRENPEYPYPLTKFLGSRMSEYFGMQKILPTIIVRPAVVFGPTQIDKLFIPEAIKAVLTNIDFTLINNGQQKRDYLYIKDLVDALMILATTPGISGEVFNIGSGGGFLQNDVFKLICELSRTRYIKFHNKIDLNTTTNQWMDVSKIKNRVGWKPSTNLQDGLAKTLHWNRLYYRV